MDGVKPTGSDNRPLKNLLAAFTSHGIAIDDQGMQNQFGFRTTRVGAFSPLPRMPDQGAVAVPESGATFPATTHRSVVTPPPRIQALAR